MEEYLGTALLYTNSNGAMYRDYASVATQDEKTIYNTMKMIIGKNIVKARQYRGSIESVSLSTGMEIGQIYSMLLALDQFNKLSRVGDSYTFDRSRMGNTGVQIGIALTEAKIKNNNLMRGNVDANSAALLRQFIDALPQ